MFDAGRHRTYTFILDFFDIYKFVKKGVPQTCVLSSLGWGWLVGKGGFMIN